MGARLTDLGPVGPRAAALLRRAGAPRGRRPLYRGVPQGVPHLDMGPSFGAWIGPPEPRGAGRRRRGSWRIRGWVSGPGGHPEPSEAMKITEITHGKPGRAYLSFDTCHRQGDIAMMSTGGVVPIAVEVG